MTHRILVAGPSSGLAEQFVLAAPAGWSFEGLGQRAAVHTADRYEVVHLVDAREIGPLEYAVRANDCDTVVSFLQEGDRRRCQMERPLPGEAPAGSAWEVNVLAAEAIGRAAVSERKRVIAVSTDEVFPERGGPAPESAAPLSWGENPSWYGGTWAEAESLLGRLQGSIAIVRVSSLFGWTLDPECDGRFAASLSGSREEAPAIVQPTFVADAVRAIQRLVEEPLSGVVHVGVADPMPRAELASAFQQVRRGTGPSHEVVPERHPGLVTGRLRQLGFRPTPWAEALENLGRDPRS